MSDHPMTDEQLGAHLDRNQWQDGGFIPERMPPGVDEFVDPRNGVDWTRDNLIEHYFSGQYHTADIDGDGVKDELDTWRGQLPDAMVDHLQHDPSYQTWFDHLATGSGLSVEDTTPGAQATFNPITGCLVDNGTWDAASPSTDLFDHQTLDVAPHEVSNAYAPIDVHAGTDYDPGSSYSCDDSGDTE